MGDVTIPTWQSEDGFVQLYLGDCLSILPRLAAGSVDAVVTDPPYGIAYQSAWRIDREKRFDVLFGDDVIDTRWTYLAYRICSGCLFCFCRWDMEHQLRQDISNAGWRVRSQVIWDRVSHGLGDLKTQYAPQHDNAIFAIRNGYTFPNSRPKTVYRIDRVPSNALLHPTQKPDALMRRIVMDVTRATDTVLDPFMGSGTTGVACVQMGRKFIGCEIDAKYFDIAKNRLLGALYKPHMTKIRGFESKSMF